MTYMRYMDKAGSEIDLRTYAKLIEDPGYKTIGRTRLWWGGIVSTVWLGLNHAYRENECEIFETMVFTWNYTSIGDYCERYATLEQAEQGHKEAIKIFNHPKYIVPAIAEAIKIWRRRREANNRRRA